MIYMNKYHKTVYSFCEANKKQYPPLPFASPTKTTFTTSNSKQMCRVLWHNNDHTHHLLSGKQKHRQQGKHVLTHADCTGLLLIASWQTVWQKKTTSRDQFFFCLCFFLFFFFFCFLFCFCFVFYLFFLPSQFCHCRTDAQLPHMTFVALAPQHITVLTPHHITTQLLQHSTAQHSSYSAAQHSTYTTPQLLQRSVAQHTTLHKLWSGQ